MSHYHRCVSAPNGLDPPASPVILVVEDDPSTQRMLRRVLEAERFRVRAAGDGGSALAAVAADAPDVIVLDLGLPGVDGLAVCRRLRAAGIGTPILVLTARDAVPDRVAGLEAGADDYLPKPFAPEELVARVRALARRAAPPAVLVWRDLALDAGGLSARRGSRSLALTGREAGLLGLLMRRPGAVVTREAALEAVWGDAGAAVPNAVDQVVAGLRRKLGPPDVIRAVRGVGFALEG